VASRSYSFITIVLHVPNSNIKIIRVYNGHPVSLPEFLTSDAVNASARSDEGDAAPKAPVVAALVPLNEGP